MKNSARILLTGVALFATACDPPPKPAQVKPSITTQGVVRHIVYGLDTKNPSYIVIEGDDRTVFTVEVSDNVPPVWVGMHGIFKYEPAEGGVRYKNFVVVRRLPSEEKLR